MVDDGVLMADVEPAPKSVMITAAGWHSEQGVRTPSAVSLPTAGRLPTFATGFAKLMVVVAAEPDAAPVLDPMLGPVAPVVLSNRCS